MKKYAVRSKIIAILFIAITSIFIIKLFYIQILNKNYKFSANNNVLRYEVEQAVRGLIFDRNEKLIVANKPAYDLMIIPREINKIDTNSLCKLTKITKKEFIEKYNLASNYSRYKESVFLKHIQLEDASKLAEKLFEFPGFYLRKLTMRSYPHNFASHVIGYLGEVNTKKTQEDRYYVKGDLSGISGIEAAYEKYLRGSKGMSIKLVDVHNRDQGKFQNGKFDTIATSGKNIISTIDFELQKLGEQLMKNKVGAIVAIEPKSGEILSLVSSPDYSLKDLTGRKRTENYKKLITNNKKPLFNRALQGSYPPGSTFKLINGLIALQEKGIKENSMFSCSSGYEYDKNKIVKCHPHKTPLSLDEAIEISCNSYFCMLFEKYFSSFSNMEEAYNNWYSHVKSFGVGDYLNNDFINGNPGKLPDFNFYNKLYKKSWNANTIISMSIGQGELLLTPIQMANITSIIANRGYFYTPHIIKKIQNAEIDSAYKEKRFCSIDKKYFDVVINGMEMVVSGDNGTALESKIDGLDICGKTGTAQNPHGEDHSIFIAFAPKKQPKIAIAVYIENGGWGSKWAAPIGTLMIEKYLTNFNINKDKINFIINSKL